SSLRDLTMVRCAPGASRSPAAMTVMWVTDRVRIGDPSAWITIRLMGWRAEGLDPEDTPAWPCRLPTTRSLGKVDGSWLRRPSRALASSIRRDLTARCGLFMARGETFGRGLTGGFGASGARATAGQRGAVSGFLADIGAGRGEPTMVGRGSPGGTPWQA